MQSEKSEVKSAKIGGGSRYRTRGWAFTKILSKHSTDSVKDPKGQKDRVEQFIEDVCANDDVDYIVVGWEIAPTTGRAHLQGYLYAKNKLSFSTVKDKLGIDVHLESARGTAQQNRIYCIKGGVFGERGVCPQMGKRRDIDDLKDMMAAGSSERECVMASSSYQAAKHVQLLFSLKKPKLEFNKKEVIWYWGPTGTGKSRRALAVANERGYSEDTWISGSTLQWFQFYMDEKCAIFDDLRYSSTEFATLLRLLDGYPYCVPVKGSARWWIPKLIIITTPYHPRDWSNVCKGEDIEQLVRRIDCIVEFKVANKEDQEKKKNIEIVVIE